ncbi:MAG TPA: ribonuclease P protein component [Micromonosporaceae bacterium]
MLAPTQRLRRSSDFAAAVRAGRRAARGAVVVHLRVHSDGPPGSALAATATLPPRAGFVVSKSVGGAVTRNTVRRRLRHLARGRLASLPPGSTLVVRALPTAANASYARLASDLDAAVGAALAPGRSWTVAS